MGALQDFQARFGGGGGGGTGNPLQDFESRFSVAKLNPKNSQKAGGLNRLDEKQLSSLGYKPSDIADWNDLPERQQKKLEDVLIGIASKSSPTLNPGYKPGSLPNNNVINQDLSTRSGLRQALPTAARENAGGLANALAGNTIRLGKTAALLPEYSTQASIQAARPLIDALGFKDQADAQARVAQAKINKLQPESLYTKETQKDLNSKDLQKANQAFAKTVFKGGVGAGSEIAPMLAGGSLAKLGIKEAAGLLAKTSALSAGTNVGSGFANGNYDNMSATDRAKAIGLDAALGAATEVGTYGAGRLLGKITSSGTKGLVDTLTNQTSSKSIQSTLNKSGLGELTGVSNKLAKATDKTQVQSILSDAAIKADRKAVNTPVKQAATIAEDFYPEGTPKAAAYKALADPAVDQSKKYEAAVASYRAAAPKSTNKEAQMAVASVLDDINTKSLATIRKGLGNTEPAVVTGVNDKGVKASLNKIFSPLNNLSDETKKSFAESAGSRHAASVQKTALVNELRKTAKESGTKLDMDLARKIEDGTAPDTAFTRQLREVADKTHRQMNEAGIDVGYRENYLPHIWQKSEEEVDQIARSAGMKPRAAGERVIPTYQEGIDLGLKPKYKDPADMMGDYIANIQNSRANVALIDDLNKQGLLMEGRQKGWKTITAESFPRSSTGSPFSAPAQVADVINNIYGTSDSLVDKALGKTARFNSVWQDIALAGGVPKTPANFFTFSQIMKEEALAAGHILHPVQGAKQAYNPLAAFVTSFSKDKTAKIQLANKQFLNDLAENGAPLNFSTNAGKWDSLFNDPTFGRFMPTMQLGTAKNVFSALEKKGVPKSEAMAKTADIMKKMYGITDQLATGRSNVVQDAIGTLGFAPKYRESIMNVLANTAKSLADPRTYKDEAYSLNRRLAVGMGVTFAAYNAANIAATGHSMFQNPEGKELQLAIPYGDGKAIYIPFMPSFMTIPRAAVGAAQSLAKGDLAGVGGELGKMLSMPIQTATQLASNKDYFGRPIVNDENSAKETGKPTDSFLEMLKKRGLYLAGQSSPAAVRGGLDYAQGKPLEQVLAGVGEAPVRFGNLYKGKDKGSSVSPGQITGDFYDKYSVLKAQSSGMESEINKANYQRGASFDEAKNTAEKFNNDISKNFEDFFKKYGNQLTDEDRKKYESMLDNLKIDVRKNKKSDKYSINKY